MSEAERYVEILADANIAQKVPRLTSEGCPLCASTTAGYGVERVSVPNLEVPLLAVACCNCGYVMLFNEQSVLAART